MYLRVHGVSVAEAAQMFAAPEACAVTRHEAIRCYLEQLATVALEVSRRRDPLSTFLGILRLAVPTLIALSQECRARIKGPWLHRRIAAGQ
jgi:hypothetical protein